MMPRRRKTLAHSTPLSLCYALLSLPCLSSAHMKLSDPVPINDPSLDGPDPNYDETSPLDPSGDNFPCGVSPSLADTPWSPTATYSAGQGYTVSIAGSAPHDGGSCQLSLSYDNTTFQVIKSMIGGCPLTTTYDFTIPSDAPNGNAIFAWSWQNEIGNREFYMNCAQVVIQGGSNAYGGGSDALGDLPQIWVANIADQNACNTTEGIDPVYPHPGCDVVYGNGLSASSPASSGDCDYGSSQPDCSGYVPGVLTENATSSYPPVSSAAQAVINANMDSDPGMDMADMMPSTAAASMAYATSMGMTLTTATDYMITLHAAMAAATTSDPPIALRLQNAPANAADLDGCPPDVTVTVTAPVTRTVTEAEPTTTITIETPCSSSELGTVTRTASTRGTTRLPPPPPHTSPPPPPPPPQSSLSPPPPPPPNSNTPPYAGNVMDYMPCTPGYFLCTDANTFWTCDQTTNPSQRWLWQYPRKVAAGMMCQPNLAACATGSEGCGAGTQYVPKGFTREDLYVRAAGS